MPTIRPFRDINQHNVLNLYTFNPSGTYPAVKGTFVKVLSGWNTEQNLTELGDVGAHYGNVVSQRYGIAASVATCTSSGDSAIGMLLYDVRETDENGEKLVYHPDKAARMQAVVSGQAVPILQKGLVLYSGVNGGGKIQAGAVVPGAPAYLGTDGGINTSGSLVNASVTRIGTFVGVPDANNWVLLKVDL